MAFYSEIGVSYILHSVYRFIQFVFGVAVIGLYATDLNAAHKAGKYSDSKWGYAVATGTLSSFTALLYLVPFLLKVPFLFLWDTVLFILWIALFGLFGNMFIREDPEGNGGIKRMKNAVWIDLVNALLWLVSAVGMVVVWWRARGSGRSRWTGRAAV